MKFRVSICVFILYNIFFQLVENLAEVTENGTRDQQTDALVSQSLGFLD